MNESPICPWCHGPVLRSAHRCWVCIPCATLHENAKRTGAPVPWANTPLFTRMATDEPTPPGGYPRKGNDLAPFEGWYDQQIRHCWGLSRFAVWQNRRYDRRLAKAIDRRSHHARRAMADGTDVFRQRLERDTRVRQPGVRFKTFATCAADDVRTDVAAVLARYQSESHRRAFLVLGVGDALLQRGERVDPDEVERYFRTVLPHVTAEELNGLGWPSGCQDECGAPCADSLWLVVFHRLPTGLPDRVCKVVFDLMLDAGATPRLIEAEMYCRSESKHVPDAWKDHLAHLLLDFTKQHVRRRIDQGESLIRLANEERFGAGFLGLLERAGLNLAEVGNDLLNRAIGSDPNLAERIVVAMARAGKDFNDLAWPPLHHAVDAAAVKMMQWGPWLPHEQAAQWAELERRRRIVDLLIDAGANVNAGESNGSRTDAARDSNPVLTAIEKGDLAMVHHLHRRGAHVEIALHALQAPERPRWNENRGTHQRRIGALLAIQQDELRAVMAEAIQHEETPAPSIVRPRRRL